MRAVIATAVQVEGSVERRAFLQPQWEPLAAGLEIHDLDEVRTGSGARARLRFNDLTEIALGEKARVQLKPSELKVDSGSIESESAGENSLAISAGSLQIRNVKKSADLKLRGGDPVRGLLEQRLAGLEQKGLGEPRLKALRARLQERSITGNAAAYESLASEIGALAAELKASRARRRSSSSAWAALARR